MSEEKKTAVTEEVKEEARKLTEEELEKVNGGQFADDAVAGSTAVKAAEALQGKAAGMKVISSNGQPGAAMNIRVRGAGSLSASTDPLIVIDGMAAVPQME